MRRFRVLYMSLARVKEIMPCDHWALISIRDPHQKVDLKFQWKRLLALEFRDASYSNDDVLTSHPKIRECINAQHAEDIRRFVDACSNNGEVDTIICHSTNYRRAAAVARFVSEETGARMDQDTTYCNSFVYKVLKSPQEFASALSGHQQPKEKELQLDQFRTG